MSEGRPEQDPAEAPTLVWMGAVHPDLHVVKLKVPEGTIYVLGPKGHPAAVALFPQTRKK